MARGTSLGNAGGSAARETRWRERIEAWGSSGQTQQEFCQIQGISRSSFSRWKSRLRQRGPVPAGSAQSEKRAPEGGVEALGWRQLAWPASSLTGRTSSGIEEGSGLELVLPSGCAIRLGPRFEAEALRRLLSVLEGAPC